MIKKFCFIFTQNAERLEFRNFITMSIKTNYNLKSTEVSCDYNLKKLCSTKSTIKEIDWYKIMKKIVKDDGWKIFYRENNTLLFLCPNCIKKIKTLLL